MGRKPRARPDEKRSEFDYLRPNMTEKRAGETNSDRPGARAAGGGHDERRQTLAGMEDRLAATRQPGRSVAITGASSFIGRNLIGLLEEDERIRRIVSIDVTAPKTAGMKTRIYNVDLTQPTAEDGVAEILAAEQTDTLVHLAFLSSPTPAIAWAHELESVGTMHLLNAARRNEVKKVILRSHTALYGAHPTNPNYLTESHPLRARRSEPFFADKIEAENDVLGYGEGKRIITILRTAPILGPTVQNYVTRFLSRRLVPTILGFDPLWQCLHEADAVAAFKLAVDRDVPGVFNVVGDGVLPLSTVVKLAGRVAVPLPRSLVNALVGALWLAQTVEAPPTLLDYLQYLCVGDGDAAKQKLGFVPVYTTREAILDFASAQHLRDARLLSETAA